MSSAYSTSLIIPAYNAAWCLDRCLKSVAGQTLPFQEVLVGIDACQETKKKALEWDQSRLAVRFFWFPRHSGCYLIRNTLAALSSGDRLTFFDSDDEMMPCYHEEMARYSDPLMPAPHRVNAKDFVRETGRVDREYINPCQFMVPRETFFLMGGFEPWECGADSDMKERMERSHIPIVTLDTPAAIEHKHSNCLTRRPDTGMKSELRKKYTETRRKRRKENKVFSVKYHKAEYQELQPRSSDYNRQQEQQEKDAPVQTEVSRTSFDLRSQNILIMQPVAWLHNLKKEDVSDWWTVALGPAWRQVGFWDQWAPDKRFRDTLPAKYRRMRIPLTDLQDIVDQFSFEGSVPYSVQTSLWALCIPGIRKVAVIGDMEEHHRNFLTGLVSDKETSFTVYTSVNDFKRQ